MEFKPGDKAKLVAGGRLSAIPEEARKYLCTEVTVISRKTVVLTLAGGIGYHIRAHDGFEMSCVEKCLVRAQPPKEDMGSWAATPFADKITAPKKEPVEPCSV